MADIRVDVMVNFYQDGRIKPVAVKLNGTKHNIKHASCIARLFFIEMEDGQVAELKYDMESGSWWLKYLK